MTSKDDAAFDILHDKAPISLEEQVGARLAKGQAFTAAIENGMKLWSKRRQNVIRL